MRPSSQHDDGPWLQTGKFKGLAQGGVVHLQEMNFKTPLARAVYNAVFHPPKVAVAEMFQPRRTAFVFDLDEIGHGLDIPTTLRRSKADCPKACARPVSCAPTTCALHLAVVMRTLIGAVRLSSMSVSALLFYWPLVSPAIGHTGLCEPTPTSLLLHVRGVGGSALCPVGRQVVETMLGGVDAGVMERLAKVMGYMRVTAAGKPGKRLKKREKLAMLAGGGGLAVRPLNGALALQAAVKHQHRVRSLGRLATFSASAFASCEAFAQE